MGIEQLTVDYVEHSGDDISVVNAARVSFDKKSDALGYSGIGDGPMIPVVNDVDKKLIKYLADHEHYSPFNHTFVTFRCSAPLFVMGQLKKHEYMPWNEISRRYINSEPEFYTPSEWRGRPSKGNSKQGSEGVVDIKGNVPVGRAMYACRDAYNGLLKAGVCPEQARMVLPQSMMSSWIWSGTVKAIAKMCKLRCKPDTQYESRVIADKISEHMHTLFPVSWSALMGTNYPRIRPMSDDERQRAKEKAV